ncbi:ATP-dependent helicase, partial [Desulfobulbus sp. US1]|nr:ATP-dependent helicase [Desulfobulbus sp. US1]
MYKVIQTKSLNKCFRILARNGKKGKDAITKVRAALTEAGTEGSIASLKRTNHGESRLGNIEKYDLGSGYRLVVQLVDGKNNVRAFLFTGDHEDSEQWLESHKDYTWVKSEKDHTLEFVQVSEKEPRGNRIVDPDIDSAEELRVLPLLRHLNSDDWSALSIGDALKDYVLSISSEAWECDPGSILEHLEKESGIECAILFDDLFTHAHKGELSQLSTRIRLELGAAKVTSGSELVTEMQEPKNSEIFVTWEEVSTLPDDSSWADWLLFLHPEQKILSTKEFRGAARLRGVSGSGKTCVMLHRARYLAKKLKEPILLVTLTESMRKLLDSLISELCGVESLFIHTSTINALAQSIVKELHPKGEAAYRMADDNLNNNLLIDTVESVKQHNNFKNSRLAKLNYQDLKRFVEEEVYYIRSRLKYSEFDKYLDPQSFKRHGRKIGLTVEARSVLLDAARYRINGLKKAFGLDYEGVVSAALSLLTNDEGSLGTFGWAKVDTHELESKLRNYAPYRCVLVDEVQDLSQLEVAMIGALPATNETTISNIENGLFLVGDGAQTIYNKGFVLKNCGINVSNRSYVLKKNYRNSKEIMLASYSLIEKYEF